MEPNSLLLSLQDCLFPKINALDGYPTNYGPGLDGLTYMVGGRNHLNRQDMEE